VQVRRAVRTRIDEGLGRPDERWRAAPHARNQTLVRARRRDRRSLTRALHIGHSVRSSGPSIVASTRERWCTGRVVEAAETRYALTTDGDHIAYQMVGDGPVDVLVEPVVRSGYRPRRRELRRVLATDDESVDTRDFEET